MTDVAWDWLRCRDGLCYEACRIYLRTVRKFGRVKIVSHWSLLSRPAKVRRQPGIVFCFEAGSVFCIVLRTETCITVFRSPALRRRVVRFRNASVHSRMRVSWHGILHTASFSAFARSPVSSFPSFQVNTKTELRYKLRQSSSNVLSKTLRAYRSTGRCNQ